MNASVFLIIFLSAFGLLILGAVIGNILESSGTVTKETIGSRGTTAVMVVYFVLFCVLGFSIVPLAIRVFIFLQIKIGNAEVFLVRFLQAHEQSVVFGVWGLFVLGLCIAVPAGIKDGFFK
jgi:hypothetical protein